MTSLNGVQLVELVGTIKSAPVAEQDLGAGIAGGELPHAQACVLYIIRTGVVEQLSEIGQRLLLDRCSPNHLSRLYRMLVLSCHIVKQPFLALHSQLALIWQ